MIDYLCFIRKKMMDYLRQTTKNFIKYSIISIRRTLLFNKKVNAIIPKTWFSNFFYQNVYRPKTNYSFPAFQTEKMDSVPDRDSQQLNMTNAASITNSSPMTQCQTHYVFLLRRFLNFFNLCLFIFFFLFFFTLSAQILCDSSSTTLSSSSSDVISPFGETGFRKCPKEKLGKNRTYGFESDVPP